MPTVFATAASAARQVSNYEIYIIYAACLCYSVLQFTEVVNVYKPKVITPKQLSEYLNCSINTAYDLCRRRDFPSFKVGRKILIIEDELYSWMLKQTTK